MNNQQLEANKQDAPTGASSATCWADLAAKAYQHGCDEVHKTEPLYAIEKFHERPKSVQRGFIAAMKYAVKHAPPNAGRKGKT